MASVTPLRFADQLRPLLRALRQQRGLTQAQLGARLGFSQARVAEIEANPGVVGVEQLMRVLAALDAGLSLQSLEGDTPAPPTSTDPRPRTVKTPRTGSW